jgi:3-hydroxyacyl-[acyl-carrier-protein] dehydratase
MSKTIEALIPHRVPFLFVDEIVSISPQEIIGLQTFNDRENPVLKGSYPPDLIPNVILLESMAQCGGAGVRMLGIAEGVFALANIETAQFFASVTYGVQLRYVIKNVRLGAKLVRQQGNAYAGKDLIFEASWMSIKIG